MAETVKARCVHCRADISVLERYQHGDHIKCGACGMQHKVARADGGLRLVLADVAPIKEALRANRLLVERLEDEYRGARGSIGIGANGVGIGVAYFLYLIAFEDQVISAEVALRAGLVALAAGVALELANYLFLAKRQRMRRISTDRADARAEGKELEKRLRDASSL